VEESQEILVVGGLSCWALFMKPEGINDSGFYIEDSPPRSSKVAIIYPPAFFDGVTQPSDSSPFLQRSLCFPNGLCRAPSGCSKGSRATNNFFCGTKEGGLESPLIRSNELPFQWCLYTEPFDRLRSVTCA
jgi:hypothetical protein